MFNNIFEFVEFIKKNDNWILLNNLDRYMRHDSFDNNFSDFFDIVQDIASEFFVDSTLNSASIRELYEIYNSHPINLHFYKKNIGL